MKKKSSYKGFSLAEILMAMGILSIGILFIAAVFPAGLYLTTISTERTIASVVADEAFAKVNLYAPNFSLPPVNECIFFPQAALTPSVWDMNEFTYPSSSNINTSSKTYCWSAIWRRLPDDTTERNVQVTVFISRKAGASTNYYRYNPMVNWLNGNYGRWPAPVPVEITGSAGNQITINPDYINFLTDNCSVIDSGTGLLYRVLSHDPAEPAIVNLDRMYVASKNPPKVWVVPPPVGGGRAPCIAVFQKIIRF